MAVGFLIEMGKGLIFPNNHFLSSNPFRSVHWVPLCLFYFLPLLPLIFLRTMSLKSNCRFFLGAKKVKVHKIENHSMANFTFVPFMTHILSNTFWERASLNLLLMELWQK